MLRGFIDIFGGEGISSLSALSDSSIKDSKKSLILVLGNRIEHLWGKKKRNVDLEILFQSIQYSSDTYFLISSF